MRRVSWRVCISYRTQLTHFIAETWTSPTIFELGARLAVFTVRHSGGGGDLPLLLEGKVFESLVEILIVGILLFCFFRFVLVALLTFVVFVVKLPSAECESVSDHEWDCAHTGSYMTLMIKLQLGHVAMSSQSLS